MGIGFAIPAEAAIKVLQDIVQHGRVIRGWLGVEARPLGAQMAQRLGLNPPQGLLITNIHTNSPAHLAGLLPGDVITKINDRWAGDNNRSLGLISKLSPGEPVKLDVWRDGEVTRVMAVAGTRPTPG